MLKKMFLVSPKQLESIKGWENIAPSNNNIKRLGKPSRGRKSSSRDGLAHNKWLQFKKKMAEEQILNETLLKITHFLGNVLPAHMPAAAAHVPTPEKRPDIYAVADNKMEAESTASSPSQENFYETPTRGAVSDVDEQEAANYTARRFGTTARPYLIKYIYDDDGEYLDTQYGIRKVDNVYMIGNSCYDRR
jgi:hypothetical protein